MATDIKKLIYDIFFFSLTYKPATNDINPQINAANHSTLSFSIGNAMKIKTTDRKSVV